MSLNNNSTLLNDILTKVNNLPDISDYTKLNFTIVGDTTQPSNATENTIWVNTSTPISGWMIRPTEPTSPSPNSVWIDIGVSSTAAFNALNMNDIQICPIACKQYVDGVWVSKVAKSYQGNKWVEWATYLYNLGDECEDITGSWDSYALKYSSAVTHIATAPSITKLEDGSMKITYGYADGSTSIYDGYGGGIVRTNKKINLSEYTALKFTGYMYNPSYDYICLCIWSDIGSYITSNVVAKINANNQKTIIEFLDLDISSLSGEYYIGFSMYANSAGGEVVVNDLKLRK